MPKKVGVLREFKDLSPSEKFATNMKIRMDRLGINQSKLSELSGLPRSTIARCYHADKVPGLDTVGVIAEALGTNISYLLNDNNQLLQMTGVPYIDKAIEYVTFHIFKGPEALPKIQHYFDTDYHLVYADRSISDPTRKGPNLLEEMELNYQQRKSRKALPYVRSASIMGMFICVHINVTTVQNTNMATELPTAVIKDIQTRTVAIMDAWRINRKLEIETPKQLMNEEFKINKRYIKVLYQSQE